MISVDLPHANYSVLESDYDGDGHLDVLTMPGTPGSSGPVLRFLRPTVPARPTRNQIR